VSAPTRASRRPPLQVAPAAEALGPRRARARAVPPPVWVDVALLAAALAVWAVVVARFSPSRVGAFGLITALGAPFFLAVALLSVSYARTLVLAPQRRWLLLLQLAALVVMLHATPVLTQDHARFPVTWLHVGFADQIGRTGEALPFLDARFNWPGFFALFGWVIDAAGIRSAVSFAAWAPVAFNVAYLVCVGLLAQRASTLPGAWWSAPWWFCLANWTGQDYLAPQALGCLLYLVTVVVVLRFFRPEGVRPLPLIGRLLERFAPDEVRSNEPTTRPQRVGLVLVLFTLVFAIAVSHQLTPVVLTAGLGALVVSGRCRLPFLPVLSAVCALAWFTLGAEPYWSGWLGELLGEVGAVDQSLEQNLGARFTGNWARLIVVGERMAFSALVAAVAVVGFLRRRRAGYGELGLALLAACPLVVLLGNSYGGEAIIRAFFFSCPFLAVFAAAAFFPSASAAAGRRAVVAVAAASMVAAPLLVLARYGNEAFEMVTAADVAALEYVYDHAPTGSTLVAPTNQAPWMYRRVADMRHLDVEPEQMDDLAVVEALMVEEPGPAYLVVTPNQDAWGQLRGGLPAGWSDRLADRLVARGGYTRVFQEGAAQVVRKDPA